MDWQDRADEFESEMKDQMADENTTEIDENLSDDEVVEETEKVPQNANLAVPDVPKEVSTFTNIATARMQEDFVSGKRDVNETGKEIVHALTLEKSVEETRENRDFLADIKKTKQDELKLNFENKVLEEERKKLEAKQNKAEAFYKSFRPILEFDFSNLRKVQKKRVIKEGEKADDMRLFRRKDGTEYIYEREQPKTYADRSYGIPLMVLMLCILTLPYCLVTIILSIFNAINEVFMQIANFGKPALVICSSLAIMAIIGVIVYVILLLVQNSFGVTIFPDKAALELLSLL